MWPTKKVPVSINNKNEPSPSGPSSKNDRSDSCTCGFSNHGVRVVYKKIPKTCAERAREYRARKKLLSEQREQENNKNIKTNADRSREFRMRKRLSNDGQTPINLSQVSTVNLGDSTFHSVVVKEEDTSFLEVEPEIIYTPTMENMSHNDKTSLPISDVNMYKDISLGTMEINVDKQAYSLSMKHSNISKKQRSNISAIMKSAIMSKPNSYSECCKEEDDEFDYFCKSIAVQLRKMPLDRALICQENLQAVMKQERLYQISNGLASYSSASVSDDTFSFPNSPAYSDE